MSDTIRVTKVGHDRVVSQINDLKREHNQATQEMANALEGKSVEENDEYLLAKVRMNQLETKISSLSAELNRFEVVEQIDFTGVVDFGTRVNVTNLDTNQTKDYILLSEYDSNVKMGIISIDSPIGMGLAGRRAGDSIEIEMPNGSVVPYEVNSVGVSHFVTTSNSNT